jgi:hypothetical protein
MLYHLLFTTHLSYFESWPNNMLHVCITIIIYFLLMKNDATHHLSMITSVSSFIQVIL